MNLSISGHHVTVTQSMRDYIVHKLERIRHHFDHVIDIHVLLSVDKLEQKAEIGLRVRGKDLFACSRDSDMYAAIDTLIDKLDRQVLKFKEKRASHPHDTVRHAALA